MNQPRPVVAVSACLLGAPVRFDGQHKRSDWVAGELARFADLVPVCPEFALGLGAPRETIRLVAGPAGDVRVISNRTARDLTGPLAETSRAIVDNLPPFDGAILQKGSPTCGPERVKLYGDNGMPAGRTAGRFAAALTAAHPRLPVADEGRLLDPAQRAHFLTRLYAQARWRTRGDEPLARFHQPHKFLLYAQSPAHYRAAGRAAAERRDDYAAAFTAGLAVAPTPGKRVNVFQHLLGFFRGKLPAKEARGLALALDDYRAGRLPYAAPLALFEHVVERFEIEYLRGQYLFAPYPKALAAGGYL